MFVIVKKHNTETDIVLVGIYSDKETFQSDLDIFNRDNDGSWTVESHLKPSVHIHTFHDGSI